MNSKELDAKNEEDEAFKLTVAIEQAIAHYQLKTGRAVTAIKVNRSQGEDGSVIVYRNKGGR